MPLGSGYGEVGLTRAFYCNELLGSPESNKKEKGKMVIYDGMIKVHTLHTYKVRTIQNSHCNLIFSSLRDHPYSISYTRLCHIFG